MKNRRYIFNILLILLIGGLSIYLSIGKQFHQVIDAFQKAKVHWIVIMALVMCCYYIFDALSLLFLVGFIKRIIRLNNLL